MTTILPSIASANQSNLSEEIRRLGQHPYLHFDVEDGNFVPNITFGIKTIRALRPLSAASFDAHLMVTQPMAYIPDLLALNFQSIAFHWESAPYPSMLIEAIRNGGAHPGIALNPRTPASEILPYLPAVDYILVMTSEPDGKGDLFQPAMLEKIRILHQANAKVKIVADGGITEGSLPAVRHAGADTVVMGRAIFSASSPDTAIQLFSSY